MFHDQSLRAIRFSSVVVTCMQFVVSVGLAQIPNENAQQFRQLRDLAAKYEIAIALSNLSFPVKTFHGSIGGREADNETLEKYQKLLVAEVNRYPTTLMRNSKLKRIILCDELTYEGQRRNAIPDFEHDDLYLDVKRGDHNQRYQRKVIHHEFFHVIDYKDDGSVYADNSWSALNPAGFRYGNGGRNAQDDASTSLLTDRYPGFLNHYSTTGVEEDKAETFANMIVDLRHVQNRAAKDPVVKSKVVAMKALLEKFCPEIDEEFWKQAIK